MNFADHCILLRVIGGEKKEEKLLVGMYITTGVTVRGEEDALHVHVATICRKDIQFCVNAKLHVVNTVHVCIMIRNNQGPIRSDDTDYTRVI